jgi:hypothetical protein
MPRRGPKSLEATPELLKDIEEMAESCFTQAQMYEALGVNKQVWYKFLERNPDVRYLIRKARNKNIKITVSKLMENIQKGHQQAIQFFLTHQGGEGWKECSCEHKVTVENKLTTSVTFPVNDVNEAAKIYAKVMTEK